MRLTTSETAIAAIKRFEGFRSAAYQDAVGVWTIGYGETLGVHAGDTITEAEADQRLRWRVGAIEFDLNHAIRVAVTQGQFDALVDFEYNLGRAALDHSTLFALLNAGDYGQAAQQFPRWCHAGDKTLAGLLQRRLAEQSWFLARNVA